MQSESLRITHVVRQFYPGIGGLENFVLSLAKEQLKQGHNVEVITLDRVPTRPGERLAHHEWFEGISIRRIPYHGSTRYPLAFGVLKYIAPADIVHVHAVDFFCDFLSVTRLLHGKPLVLSTHGGFFHTPFASTLKKLFFATVTRRTLRGYRRVFACSTNDFDLFRPVTDDRLVQIDNGVDTEKFADAAAPTFKPSMLYLGRLASHKGLHELVDAFQVIAERFAGAILYIVGDDWQNVRADVEARIESTTCPQKIQIHSGFDDAQVRAIMAECSFAVSASHYEGFGLTMLEAMAAGLVPIGNDIPSFRAIFTQAGVGLTTDFSDPVRAGKAAVAYMEETAVLHEQQRAWAIAACAPYAWPTVAQRFAEQYNAVLGMQQRELLGVSLSVASRQQAIDTVDDAIDRASPINVAFANAHTLNLAATTPDFRDLLNRFLVLNDGIGVDIASFLKFGRPFAENLNGTDFVPYYLTHTRHRLRIYLAGSTANVVAKAAENFRRRWPRHEIVGTCSGFFDRPEEERLTALAIRASEADIVLVGMGNPLQEIWIDRHAPATGAKALFGVGALFDFTAGTVARAPLLIQKARGEWIYRLLQEPGRLWRRYLIGNALFLIRVLRGHSVRPATEGQSPR